MISASTISRDLAAASAWDALVIGAGPAGAIAATLMARRRRRVLLVDAKRFPRAKACGGCLSGSAASALAACGLDVVLSSIDAPPIESVRLHWRKYVGELSLPIGYAVDRARFDAALVQQAIAAGAQFLDECQTTLVSLQGDRWSIELASPPDRCVTHAKVVVAADGLLRTCLRRLPGFTSQAQPRARLGAAAIVSGSIKDPQPGAIEMTIANSGYAGAVRLDATHTLIAAALDTRQLRAHSISEAVQAILSTNGSLTLSLPREIAWKTSPTLTRRAERLAGERWFAIGDAAGYVEPFTGDGMAIAIDSAIAVTPLADAAIDAWRQSMVTRWHGEHRRLCRRRRAFCRGLAWALRRRWATRGMIELCRHAPSIAQTAFAHVQQRPKRGLWEVAGA